MRCSLVGLQLLLACVLVWGTSVTEEEKELQEQEKQDEQPVVPEEPTTEIPKTKFKKLRLLDERNSEELEERGKMYRERMQESRSVFESMFLRRRALEYFNKRQPDAFYRPIEDTDTTIQDAMGTLVTFTEFVGKTNCTLEEGRKSATPRYKLPWDSPNPVPCVALPKDKQKRLKCRITMYNDARSGRSAMLWYKCDPVVFIDGSDDEIDSEHLMDYSAARFGPSF